MLTRLSYPVMLLVVMSAVNVFAGDNPYPRAWFWGDDDQRAQHDELIGEPAPELKLSQWINGEVTPEDMKGKIIVVDFWETWCGPCINSIPHHCCPVRSRIVPTGYDRHLLNVFRIGSQVLDL